MSTQKYGLGGRLPLLKPEELPPAQKPNYDRLISGMIAWAKESNFQASSEHGTLIGPFNSLLYATGGTGGLLSFTDAEEKGGSLSERERRVVVISVGAVWKAAYELYAQSALARKAGVSEEAIQSLAKGQLPDDLTEREKVAQQFTHSLVMTHEIDDVLYAQAEQAFDRNGLVDMCYLIGRYLLVSSLLNAFQVPAPE